MKVAFFDTHGFEKEVFASIPKSFEITFFDTRLTEQTAKLAQGHDCACVFVNDRLNNTVLKTLASLGIKLIALRCAGFNQVDLNSAKALGLKVVRVPEYSPHAVAEHSVALMLSLCRKIHRAYDRVKEGNFSLNGLVGFDLHKKNIGIIGAGRIGSVLAKILLGFGSNVYVYDKLKNPELLSMGVRYISLAELLKISDIISLNIPLNAETKHILDDKTLSQTKPGVMIINTGRGALMETKALIRHLKSGHIGSAGLDVYEEEEGIFFEDHSEHILQDDQLARLLTFPNVLMTSHQGFLTKEALSNIAETTIKNISDFVANKELVNEVS